MRTATACFLLLAGLSGASDAQDSGDRLASRLCPVDGGQPRTGMTVRYNTLIVLFCSTTCRAKFIQDPATYLANVEQPAKAPPPKAEKIAPPTATGPCDVKRTVKGQYCTMCKRELGPDDVRSNQCKRCETKAVAIEYCMKVAKVCYRPNCHPEKESDKPVSC